MSQICHYTIFATNWVESVLTSFDLSEKSTSIHQSAISTSPQFQTPDFELDLYQSDNSAYQPSSSYFHSEVFQKWSCGISHCIKCYRVSASGRTYKRYIFRYTLSNCTSFPSKYNFLSFIIYNRCFYICRKLS